jgi:hypothetical protein
VSDQQLVTGLAMLVSAYSQLRCGLSYYHWKVVGTLAWFASVTHMATLSSLQDFLQRHRYVLYLRVMLMSVLAIMLAIALPMHGNYDDSRPVMCGTWDIKPIGTASGAYTLLSEFILLGTLVSRFLRMSSHTSHCPMRCLRLIRTRWQDSIIYVCNIYYI